MTFEDFIFTKSFPQRLLRHIVFWICYYLFSLVTYFHDGLEKAGFTNWLLLEMFEVLCQLQFQIMFCYAVLYYLIPVYFDKKKYARFYTGLLLLFTGCFVLDYFETFYLFGKIHAYVGLRFRPPNVFMWFTVIALLSYVPVSAGLAISIRVLKRFYVKQKENQVLIRENANAALQLLKAQVHPHFLFNTLNNIYSFALSKSPEAPALITKLSDTVRYMITDCNNNSVMLEQELQMLEDYMGLEKVRYGDRLEIQLNITKDHHGRFIAPLLMIPFVENCFKHGSSVMRGKQWIRLSIQVNNNMLEFNLSNSKPAAPEAASNKGGIGLLNVKKRLALLYPEKHQLNISASADVYDVHMEIELQKIQAGKEIADHI